MSDTCHTHITQGGYGVGSASPGLLGSWRLAQGHFRGRGCLLLIEGFDFFFFFLSKLDHYSTVFSAHLVFGL